MYVHAMAYAMSHSKTPTHPHCPWKDTILQCTCIESYVYSCIAKKHLYNGKAIAHVPSHSKTPAHINIRIWKAVVPTHTQCTWKAITLPYSKTSICTHRTWKASVYALPTVENPHMYTVCLKGMVYVQINKEALDSLAIPGFLSKSGSGRGEWWGFMSRE